MMKVIRALCKYIPQKFKKMTISSQVKILRIKLLQNCTYAIERLEASEYVIEKGPSLDVRVSATFSEAVSFSKDIDSSDISSKNGDKSKITEDSKVNIKDELFRSFIILTHGVLIQEWEHFLYDVFIEGIIYYLKGYDLDTPRFNIKFKNLNPTRKITEMRKNIASEAKDSLYGYKDLFEQSSKLFKVVVSQPLKKEMKKQVQVRHVFQHNRGKIRKMDLKDIGKEGGYFDILNDEGRYVKRKVGDKIYLSRKEIQKLYDTIEKYSEAFQEQAEKIKLISS